MLSPPIERTYQRLAKARSIERHQPLHEHEVDRVFDAAARLAVISASAGMNLLGDVLLERQHGYFDRLNIREGEQV